MQLLHGVAPVAHIENRSPWLVEVPEHPDLLEQFSINEKKLAQAYCAQLAADGHHTQPRQLDTRFVVVDARANLRLTAQTRAQALSAPRHG